MTILDRFRLSEQIPLPLPASLEIAVGDDVVHTENEEFAGRVVSFKGEKAMIEVSCWQGPTLPRSPVPVPRTKLRRA